MYSDNEEVTRLKPLPSTVRRLFAHSGNLCAYLGCRNLMIDENGDFVGQICHIESAMPKGERFNPHMTNEDRREFRNLVLMCYQHHIKTNREDVYTVERMKEIKANHERKYSENIIEQKILDSLQDYTEIKNLLVEPNTLEHMFDIIYEEDNIKYRREIEEIEEDVEAFNAAISAFQTLSLPSRKIFLIALKHSYHPFRSDYSRNEEELFVDISTIANVVMQSYQSIKPNFDEIVAKSLMVHYEVDPPYGWSENTHIISNVTPESDSGAYIWLNLRRYCELTNKDIVTFIEKLNFSDLD